MKHHLILALLSAACAGTAVAMPPLRDPFVRPAAALPAPAPAAAAVIDEPPAPLRLRALILNGERSLANIDGDVVAAGQKMPGYTVLRIDARGALVQRGGRRELLAVQDGSPPNRQAPAPDRSPE